MKPKLDPQELEILEAFESSALHPVPDVKTALSEGQPYQTLIASLLHDYAEGGLVEQL